MRNYRHGVYILALGLLGSCAEPARINVGSTQGASGPTSSDEAGSSGDDTSEGADKDKVQGKNGETRQGETEPGKDDLPAGDSDSDEGDDSSKDPDADKPTASAGICKPDELTQTTLAPNETQRSQLRDRILDELPVQTPFTSSGGQRVFYNLHDPRTAGANSNVTGDKFPLVVMLTGGGARYNGEPDYRNALLDSEGMVYIGEAGLLSPEVREKFPTFILHPHCPNEGEGNEWWGGTLVRADGNGRINGEYILGPPSRIGVGVIELIAHLVATLPIDTRRIYLTGFSMGAIGVWDYLARFPGCFAGAVPMGGHIDTMQASKLKDLPIWMMTSVDDPYNPTAVNDKMYQGLMAAGAKCVTQTRIPVDPNAGDFQRHAVWLSMYQNSAYLDSRLWPWLFSQVRGGAIDEGCFRF